MFELIIDKVPELRKLEETVAKLEREQAEAQAKVVALSNKVLITREDDLDREAVALNNGRKPPKPKEPELLEQLERAQRDLAVLERRLTLAGGDRSRYIQEHHQELMRLLSEAQAAEGAKVAEAAARALERLLVYYHAEDDARALRRLVPEPVQENTDEPAKTTAVWGPVNRQNFGGGPPRGNLESVLRHLTSLGPATEVGEDTSEAGAA